MSNLFTHQKTSKSFILNLTLPYTMSGVKEHNREYVRNERYGGYVQYLHGLLGNVRISRFTPIHIFYTILSYFFYLDWINVSNEFLNSLRAKAATCKHSYDSNLCDTPVPAIIQQYIE